MKLCTVCRLEKDEAAFNKRSQRSGDLQHHCKVCQKAYNQQRYKKDREPFLRRIQERRFRAQEQVNRAKGVPCTDCGRRYPPWVMDFDHVRGVKVRDVSKMASHGASEKALRDEIAKCEVVCSNCHRERTYRRMKNCFVVVFPV